jgi:hypothetical protein
MKWREPIVNLFILNGVAHSNAVALAVKLQYKGTKSFVGFERLIGLPN